MSRIYQRTWAIEVGDEHFEGLTLGFSAAYPGDGNPATCDVTLFVPPNQLVAALYDESVLCRVLAGYQEGGAVEVFSGTPIRASVKDKRAARDPAVSWQLSASRAPTTASTIAQSWSDVWASEVITTLRQAMGLAAGYIELPVNVRYARGYVVEGAPLRELASVVADCRAAYSIEGGRLSIYSIGGAAPLLVDQWTPSSGLLDVVGPAGDGRVRAAALLRGFVRPGDTIAIASPQWSGQVKVQSVRHDGRSDQARWATSVEGVPSAG